MIKLGNQCPKGYTTNLFNYIEIYGDYAYCKSHNFIYSPEIEQEKLYNAKPCYYTDKRFVDSIHNYAGQAGIFSKRFTPISLKSCIRRTLNTRNIPINTIVKFSKSWYFPGKKVDLSYLFKIRKENKLDIEYNIDLEQYSDNFTKCEFSQQLTNALRNAGFIVGVYRQNHNFISSMIHTAAMYIGETYDIKEENGEIAIAYGFGKKIGFSSFNNSFKGYSNGCDNILWDNFGYFNKWSQSREISKSTDIDLIIKLLQLKDLES